MSRFYYRATDANGLETEGSRDAENAHALRWTLREEGLRPVLVEIDERPSDTGAFFGNPFALLPPRQAHLELSLRQVAVMLRSGLPLLSAIETTVEQAPSRAVRRVWAAIRDALENGSSLTEAMEPHKRFTPATLQLIALGEESGNLELVMERAAQAMEQRRILVQTTLSALAYPAITLLAAIAIATYMVLGVIPQMERFLSSLGRRLPPMTQSLLDLSNWIQQWAMPILIVGTAMLVAAIAFYLWPPGRLAADRLVLRIPLVGRILRTSATAAFVRSLGLLLHSGISLLESLRAVRDLHRNRHLAGLIDSARQEIVAGQSLAESLDVPHAYTPMLSKMIAVGEASGALDDILEQMAEFHEAMLKTLLKQLSALIEPAIIFVVGGIVGYVYIAFFLGLFAATGSR